MQINKKTIEELGYGGVILGCGGGGSMAEGVELAETALELNTPKVISIDELEDEELVVTISAVGSPSSTEKYVSNEGYNRILELITEQLGKKPAALITNEIGGASSFNPFITAAMNDLPILDAACNGRAHPLGAMGAMGLSEKAGYVTDQSAVGGKTETNAYVELVTKGSVRNTSSIVLAASIAAGGLVVVARNAVSIEYAKGHAAVEALSFSQNLGQAYLNGTTVDEKLLNVVNFLNGEIVVEGIIENYVLETTNGLDVGTFFVGSHQLRFWNEYMTLDIDGVRKYTFPDFIMSFDKNTGMPITTAEIENGIEVVILASSHHNLLLGAGMFERSGYEAIEQALGVDILSYVQDLINR